MRKVVTNCFLLREGQVCLAMKKRGLGVGLWNGTGGKLQEGETVIDAAKREAREELGVDLGELEPRGEALFVFEDNFEVFVHLFLCHQWQGEPIETEEMAPEWFDIDKIPYETMWQTDKHWLPVVLRGTSINAVFNFNPDGKTVKNFDLKEI